MRLAIEQRGGRRPEADLAFSLIGDDRIIVSTIRPDDEGRRNELHQVLTIRDAKIVDMQDCATKRQAERFARRHRV